MVTGAEPFAALDVGSNTIRLLVATYDGAQLVPLRDASEFVRLGKGVDSSGRLANDRILAAMGAIRSLLAEARTLGASEVDVFATSAVRDASNREEFEDFVHEVAGVRLRVLSGDEEASLTFLGATLGRPLSTPTVVCDLGGGSTELIYATPDGMQWAKSVQLGSGRLTEQFIHHDPPAEDEVRELGTYVSDVLEGLPPADPTVAVATGGTASAVVALLRQSGPAETVSSSQLAWAQGQVNTRPQAEIVQEFGVRPERAEVLPAGIMAIDTMLKYYRLNTLTITTGGIREGSILRQWQFHRA